LSEMRDQILVFVNTLKRLGYTKGPLLPFVGADGVIGLRRTYRASVDPKWRERLPKANPDAVVAAKSYLLSLGVPDAEVDTWIADLLAGTAERIAALDGSAGATLDLGFPIKHPPLSLAPQIRALLGEVADPRATFT